MGKYVNYGEALGVDIYAKTRKQENVIARYLVWLVLHNSGYSYSAISREFSNFHYLTVRRGVIEIKKRILDKEPLAMKYYNKLNEYVIQESS